MLLGPRRHPHRSASPLSLAGLAQCGGGEGHAPGVTVAADGTLERISDRFAMATLTLAVDSVLSTTVQVSVFFAPDASVTKVPLDSLMVIAEL